MLAGDRPNGREAWAVSGTSPVSGEGADFQVEPASVEQLPCLYLGLAARTAVSVSGMLWGQLLLVRSLLPPELPHISEWLPLEETGRYRTV